MLDQTHTPQIYVACLASYNSGRLHGRWIDATSDVDAMQEQVAAMLAASPMPDAEEWAIHDYDSFPNLGEYPGLEAVAAMAQLFEDFDHIDADDLQAILANFHDPERARTELDHNFCGIFDNFRDYADDAADETLASCGRRCSMTARCINCCTLSDRAHASPFLCQTCEDRHRPGRRHTLTTYATELTPIGEQLVIPGCEKQDRPTTAQLSLFGG